MACNVLLSSDTCNYMGFTHWIEIRAEKNKTYMATLSYLFILKMFVLFWINIVLNTLAFNCFHFVLYIFICFSSFCLIWYPKLVTSSSKHNWISLWHLTLVTLKQCLNLYAVAFTNQSVNLNRGTLDIR